MKTSYYLCVRSKLDCFSTLCNLIHIILILINPQITSVSLIFLICFPKVVVLELRWRFVADLNCVCQYMCVCICVCMHAHVYGVADFRELHEVIS